MDRDLTIDIARGIGIILVVIGHVAVPFYDNLYILIYLFHMPLFFFMSGAFYRRGISFCSDVYKKIRSILCPYFIFAILGNGSFLLRDMLFGCKVTSSHLFITLINAINTPLWFLVSLFICFFIYELLNFSTSVLFQFLASVVISLIGCFACYKNYNIPLISQALLMLFYYSLGHIFMQWKGGMLYEICKFSKTYNLLALIIFFVCCTIFDKRPNVSTLEFMGHPIAFFFGSIAGIWSCIHISCLISTLKNISIRRFIAHLGENSLFIMGLHFYLIFHVYFFSIPILMRIFAMMGYVKTGEDIKSMGILNICIAIIVIALSSKLGDFLNFYIPGLFRAKSRNR